METDWVMLIFLGVIGLMALFINWFFLIALFSVGDVWYIVLVVLVLIDLTFFMMLSKVLGE